MIGPVFDGHDLGEVFVCGDQAVRVSEVRAELASVSGRDYDVHVGSTLGNGRVEFTVALPGRDPAERRDLFSRLASWLRVDGPRRLVLPDRPDRHCLAVPDSSIELTGYIDGETARIGFATVSPWHGTQRTVTVPSGGSATFRVEGTYPATCTLAAASAVRSGSSGVWGVRLDEGDYVRVELTSGSHAVSIDCADRICKVDGAVDMLTLSSDWLELEPGGHTVRMDQGTGAATLTYVERWL